MGVTTTALLTVEQFLDLPQEETERTELVEGEIVQMGNAAYLHERVKTNANKILVRYILENPIGEVFSETMYKLAPQDAPFGADCPSTDVDVDAFHQRQIDDQALIDRGVPRAQALADLLANPRRLPTTLVMVNLLATLIMASIVTSLVRSE